MTPLRDERGEYCVIELTKGQVTVVDASDYEFLSQWKWHAEWNGGTDSYYATRTKSLGGRKNRVTVRMARLIMGEPARMIVDHINHDSLNNRRYNLRIASPSQNQFNTAKVTGRGVTSSKYKGVSWNKPKKRWRAAIRIFGVKRKHLGFFRIEEDAARAYINAARELHGEFMPDCVADAATVN